VEESLNNSMPVLVSALGEKGVRDPYLIRAHDQKTIYLIAADLSINLNLNWTRATHAGSKSWSAPRLIKVAPDDAGCTWAPEAVFMRNERNT